MPALIAILRALRFALFPFTFCAFFAATIQAQQPFIRHYAVEDGLQSSNVRQCLQDQQGYIWIATNEGLNRFDGFEFKGYSYEDGLTDDDVLEIILEDSGSLLLRTPTGMFRYRNGNFEAAENVESTQSSNNKAEAPEELKELMGDEISLRNYFRDSKEGNWLCTNGDGLYRLWNDEEGSIRAEHYLENKSVNGVTEDREGNYWVSTPTSGVYFIPARVYKNLNSYNGLVSDQIDRLEALEDDWILAESPDGKLYEIDLVEGNVQPVNGKAIARDNYFDTSKGKWVFRNGNLSFAGADNKTMSFDKAKVKGAAQNQKLDRAVIGTNKGLYICQDLNQCELVNKESGLLSSKIRSVYVTSKGNMLLATNRGVSEVYGAKVDGKYRVKNITMSDGLASNDVYDVIKAGNYLCVATNRGLTYFDEKKNKKEKRLAPEIYISSLSVADSLRNWNDKLTIKPHENDIQIEYTAINYGSAGDIEYQYMVEGLSDDWIGTRNRSVRFSSLPPGDYTFKLRAKGKDGQLSAESESVDFKIKARLTQTYTFRALMLLLGLGIIGLLAYWRIRSIRKDNEIKSQMVEMEQQALRAQMNPHFIFNSLSSIQQFINTNEKRTANKYLARFAELMRRILYNSRRANITLKDEVETLQLYMELEALRFNEQLDYSVEVVGGTDQLDLQIPTMFIQPYVENAILHGVPPIIQEGRRGKVEVKFHPKEDHVYCTVEDNGVGRERARAIKDNRQIKKESTAMKNIEQRIALLSPGKEVDDLVKVIDLKNDDGVASGTRIEIQIPYV